MRLQRRLSPTVTRPRRKVPIVHRPLMVQRRLQGRCIGQGRGLRRPSTQGAMAALDLGLVRRAVRTTEAMGPPSPTSHSVSKLGKGAVG